MTEETPGASQHGTQKIDGNPESTHICRGSSLCLGFMFICSEFAESPCRLISPSTDLYDSNGMDLLPFRTFGHRTDASAAPRAMRREGIEQRLGELRQRCAEAEREAREDFEAPASGRWGSPGPRGAGKLRGPRLPGDVFLFALELELCFAGESQDKKKRERALYFGCLTSPCAEVRLGLRTCGWFILPCLCGELAFWTVAQVFNYQEGDWRCWVG